MEEKGFHFMGCGISGGEQGARTGPSIMPGGDSKAYEDVRSMLEAVAAKVGGVPCVAYLGKGAAGAAVQNLGLMLGLPDAAETEEELTDA